MHLVITDSGLGGLAVCAAAEKALRRATSPTGLQAPAPASGGSFRITYFNAWPEPEIGYNDMPDLASRARAFDRALAAMAALGPDRIVIACNTLSVVYGQTAFSRTSHVPVLGIVDAGVDLFGEALFADRKASIVLFGTKTTIESGVHRTRLIDRGIAPERIGPVACHGLARAIETDPDSAEVAGHIDRCTKMAGETAPPGDRLYFGVCCTHYTYVREEMRAALERATGRPVQTLDPNDRLVGRLMRETMSNPPEGRSHDANEPAAPHGDLWDPASAGLHGDTSGPASAGLHQRVPVTVLSKVEMDDRKRQSIARRLEAVSPGTVAALLAYTRVPDLF